MTRMMKGIMGMVAVKMQIAREILWFQEETGTPLLYNGLHRDFPNGWALDQTARMAGDAIDKKRCLMPKIVRAIGVADT
jgi:hypothetical protein